MIEVLASLLLLVAAVFDYKTMRIPNLLQVVAFLAITLAILVSDPQSWRIRLISAGILVLIFLIFFALKQSGGGDLKMVAWLGAGFGLDAFGVLALGVICMSIWIVVQFIARRQRKMLPLAPFLFLGLILWGCMNASHFSFVFQRSFS